MTKKHVLLLLILFILFNIFSIYQLFFNKEKDLGTLYYKYVIDTIEGADGVDIKGVNLNCFRNHNDIYVKKSEEISCLNIIPVNGCYGYNSIDITNNCDKDIVYSTIYEKFLINPGKKLKYDKLNNFLSFYFTDDDKKTFSSEIFLNETQQDISKVGGYLYFNGYLYYNGQIISDNVNFSELSSLNDKIIMDKYNIYILDEIIKNVDFDNFEEQKNDKYYFYDGILYFIRDDKTLRMLEVGEDFNFIGEPYLKSNGKIYCNLNEIGKADFDTFNGFDNTANDKNYNYNSCNLIDGIYSINYDLHKVFVNNDLIEYLDFDTFETLGFGKARDKYNIYCGIDICNEVSNIGGTKTRKINNKTYRVLNYGYSKDKNGVYFGNTILDKVDLDSFTVINDEIGKDKNFIIFGTEIKKNIDVNTFLELGKNFYKDKNNIYDKNLEIILGIDLDSFEILNESTLKDKNGIYYPYKTK